jgi:hypothetical protein
MSACFTRMRWIRVTILDSVVLNALRAAMNSRHFP